MGARSKARRRAVDVLYEAEQRAVDARDVLTARQALVTSPLNPYVTTLVEGVLAHRDDIDAALAEASGSWPLDRMPAVDRAILRVGLYELRYVEDLPDAVAIDEAVELAKSLSTDGSPAFVNGLLGGLARAGT